MNLLKSVQCFQLHLWSKFSSLIWSPSCHQAQPSAISQPCPMAGDSSASDCRAMSDCGTPCQIVSDASPARLCGLSSFSNSFFWFILIEKTSHIVPFVSPASLPQVNRPLSVKELAQQWSPCQLVGAAIRSKLSRVSLPLIVLVLD